MQTAADEESSLDQISRLLNPKSIAIVGASAGTGSPSRVLLSNLARFGYSGNVHAVSRSAREIEGIPCVGAVEDIPLGVDLAVLCVARDAVLDIVESCVRRNVGSAVVFAAGFAEIGESGRALQQRIRDIARAGGLRLAGPNCMGFQNFVNNVPVTFETIEIPMRPQGDAIGVIAQSGAVASILREALLAKGRTISVIVSTGNEADLDISDYIEWMISEPNTRVIAIFAEQIRRPARFLSLAALARSLKKFIVVLHPGNSVRARESAASHTGALADDHTTMSAFLKYEGVALVSSVEELIDTAELLSCFPHPPEVGPALVTNSGALCGISLDFCEAIGLDLPRPSPDTMETLRTFLPSFATIDNPLDLTGQVIKQPQILTHASNALLTDPSIGSVVVSLVPGGRDSAISKVHALEPLMKERKKPIIVVAMGDQSPIAPEFAEATRRNGIPFFRSQERALRSLSHVTALGQAHHLRAEEIPAIESPSFELPRGCNISEYVSKGFISKLGIPVPRAGMVHSVNEALEVAGCIGYPVVLKVQAEALSHKSDAGGVVLNIEDENKLVEAWARVHSNIKRFHPDLKLDGILVEAMLNDGLELIVGAVRDQNWGPVIMVGFGGIWIETLKDVRLLPAQATRAAIETEINALRGAPLLRGGRGQPPSDINALVDAVAKVAGFVRMHAEITEIDINPLLVRAEGEGVVALDALIVTQGGKDLTRGRVAVRFEC